MNSCACFLIHKRTWSKYKRLFIMAVAGSKTDIIFIFFSQFLKFFLNDNCFTILYRFLTYHWLSHRYTYVPALASLPPTSHPSRLSQSLVWVPWVIQKIPLAVCSTDGSAYVSTVLSPLVPPSPSPAPQVCESVLCLHLHCCPANRFISTVFLGSTYMP